MTLDEIATVFYTDKCSRQHNYMIFYEQFMERMRDWKVRILEIGVGDGGSLITWGKYFENAEIIVAIDNREDRRSFERDKIIVEVGEQSDKDFLLEVGRKHGPFDFILDDGSHYGPDQLTALQYLLQFVKAGGYYIVEDTGCAFIGGKPPGGSIINELILLASHIAGNQPINDPLLKEILSRIESMQFYFETCVMKTPVQDLSRMEYWLNHTSAEFK